MDLLNERGLIDQIGVQGHAFNLNNANPNIVNANLNILGSTGLPVYVTELDLDGFDDYVQLTRFQRIFPVLWENENVQGITLWGYSSAA
ncbi:MAG: endo-1,4-beta-xylanase, partial [Cyclobacteriaceae bacterium]